MRFIYWSEARIARKFFSINIFKVVVEPIIRLLKGYFECLRNETRDKNIAITMLCPGPVFSDIVREAFTTKVGEVTTTQYFAT